MSVTLTPELRGLVETGVISEAQAIDAMRDAPAADEFGGFARCVNPACDEQDTDHPIRLRRSFVTTWAPDIPVILTQTSYISPCHDEEINCPFCGQPRSLLEAAAPSYQRLAPV